MSAWDDARRACLRCLVLTVAAAGAGQVWGDAAPSPQDVFNQAAAYGQQQGQTNMSNLQNGSSQSTAQNIPGYTSNPSQAQYYSSQDLAGGTAQVKAQCQSNPNDPTCSGINKGTASRPPSTVSVSSSAMGAQAVIDDPTLVLGNMAQTYNACSTGGALVSPSQFQRQTCTLNAAPWTTQACDKTLSVHPADSNSCTPGSTFINNTFYRNGGPPDTINISAVCNTQVASVAIPFKISAWGSMGQCAAPLSVSVDMSQPHLTNATTPPAVLGQVVPHWLGNCLPMVVMWEGQGCVNHNCSATFHLVQAPGTVPVYACGAGQTLGNKITFDDTGPGDGATCFMGYPDPEAASGAPGSWGMDAATNHLYWVTAGGATANGWTWAPGEHVQTTLNFQEPYRSPETGDQWSKACASLEQITPGLQADGVNSSTPPAVPANIPVGSPQCVRVSSTCTDGPSTKIIDGTSVSRGCWAYHDVFACTSLTNASTCGAPALQSCTPAGPPSCTSQDASGHCLVASQDVDCKVANGQYTPAVNCGNSSFCANGSCWNTTTKPDANFAYAISQMEAHVEAGKDFDPNSMQIFKGFDNRCGVNNFGIDDCCDNDAWISKCTSAEQQLYQKRQDGKCHEVGEYCSQSIPILGCKTHEHTFCCFTSLLARLVQEQGRTQINRSWGSPESPNCVGFTPDELAQLDWSKFDLSEFYAQIHYTAPDPSTVTNGAQNQQGNCYYGQGNC